MLDLFTSVNALLAIALAYLIGTIPFGLLLTRAAGLGDIRHIGSGNIGATNVLRTGRTELAIATLLLDGFKGFLAVLLVRFLAPEVITIAALAVVAGHVFPLWLKFKGGKGVATAIGALLSLHLSTGLIVCLVWIVVALIFKYSSLSAIVALAAAPFVYWHYTQSPSTLFIIIMALLVIWRHHSNIRRLMKGEESKIGKENL
ncbi:MAG: glycerol-3-phosphate 1-O-acyltransferase PlsY [Dongiaceae bacterium]